MFLPVSNWPTFAESGNPTSISSTPEHQARRILIVPTNNHTAAILAISYQEAPRLPTTTFLQPRTGPDEPVSPLQTVHSLTEPQRGPATSNARTNAAPTISSLQTDPRSPLSRLPTVHSPSFWRTWTSARAFLLQDDAFLR